MDFRIFNSNRPKNEKFAVPQEDERQHKLTPSHSDKHQLEFLITRSQKTNLENSALNPDSLDG